jgi:hypothetical protein
MRGSPRQQTTTGWLGHLSRFPTVGTPPADRQPPARPRSLFDDLIGACEQCRRDGEAERLGGPDINRNQSLQHRAVVNAGAPRGFAIAIAKRAAPSAATRKLEEREAIAAGFALLNQGLYLPKPPRR